MTDRPGSNKQVTALLLRVQRGDPDAVEELYPLVHDTLHARAVQILAGREGGMPWQPTAIVAEAYLKLVDQRRANWRDRHHFHRIAAMAMRRIVIDWARRELRQKRGGTRRLPLTDDITAAGLSVDELASLGELLGRLAQEHERSAQVVDLRFFGGMAMADVAESLGVSRRTVEGDWQFARTWLHERLACRRG